MIISLSMISWFVHLLLVLLAVAFFTLFERKVMGLIHLRVGPNKISMLGLLQPLLDAFKLLTKQVSLPFSSDPYFVFAPHFSLSVSLSIWIVTPSLWSIVSLNYSLVLFIVMGSLLVLGVLLAGWSSNSKYSLLGGLRGLAQSVSYEVVMTTLVVSLFIMMASHSITSIWRFSSLILALILPLWIFSTLGETHRAPFDFSESESELVSGFNTEYAAEHFAYVFLSEYGVLLFSCLIISTVILGWLFPLNVMLLMFLVLLVSFVFIWIRVTFCRFRYDYLMIAAWKMYLPVSLCWLLLVFVYWV